MQEQNNFERQVKETMDGFSIQPSVPVWQKIEREIRQKRERRRLVLWLLPLLLAGGLWLALSQTGGEQKQNGVASSTQMPASTEKGSPKGPLAPKELLEEEKLPEHSNNTPAFSSNEPDRTTVAITKKDKAGSIPEKIYTRPTVSRNPERRTVNRPAKNEVTALEKTIEATPGPGKIETEAVTQRSEESGVKKQEAVTDTPPVTSGNKEKEIRTDPNEIKATSVVDSPALAPKTEAIEPTSKPRKWKISIQATGGYAQTINSFFPLASAAESNLVPNSVGSSPRVSPGEPTPGAAFSLGPVFTTSLGTNLKFNTGIQYSYASTKQPYGDMAYGNYNGVSPTADSSQALLKSGVSNTYNNRYHFIEVPAGVSYRLFPTIPVDVHTGLSLTALVGSNAVQFDEDYGLYYNQKDKLQRIGLNAFAGFSYGLAKERLKIGPHIQYSLLPVHKKDDKRYLLIGGLRAALSLN